MLTERIPFSFRQDTFLPEQNQACYVKKQQRLIESLSQQIDFLALWVNKWPNNRLNPKYIKKIGQLNDERASLIVNLKLLEEYSQTSIGNYAS